MRSVVVWRMRSTAARAFCCLGMNRQNRGTYRQDEQAEQGIGMNRQNRGTYRQAR